MQTEPHVNSSCSKVESKLSISGERNCIATNEAQTPLCEQKSTDTSNTIDNRGVVNIMHNAWIAFKRAMANVGAWICGTAIVLAQRISVGFGSLYSKTTGKMPFKDGSENGETIAKDVAVVSPPSKRRKRVADYRFAKVIMRKERFRSLIAMFATCVVAVTAVIVLSLNYSVGFEVIANGQTLGIVDSEQTCQVIIDEINNDLRTHFGEEGTIKADVVSIPRLIVKDSYTPAEDIKMSVCELSDNMMELSVIYLDDKPLVALHTQEEAEKVIDEFENFYTKEVEGVSFSTERPLTIKNELTPKYLLRDTAAAVSMLNGTEKKENQYTIKAGDTLWSISRKYGSSVDDLISLNDGLTEDIDEGDKIVVKSYVPVVKVITVQEASYTQKMPYETEEIASDDLYKGKTEITQEGKNGEVAVVADVVKENGQEVRRDIKSSEVISEPVKQIKKVGTQAPPSGYGTGSFISPVYGTITSRMGYRRSGYHKGLDIANSYGTPIRASDNGIVTTAGWSGLFGKLVIIDHRNGYITYYGHNSSIAVSVGDVVKKGEVIAYMGSTGNSTGNHCHFEMYYNGALVNPEKYI